MCRLATPEEVKERVYSLNPGRYVGVMIADLHDMTIKPMFLDMFFPYGHVLDMKMEDKMSKRRSPQDRKQIPGLRQDASRPNRRSIRLSGYDYSQAGAYFVTICTKERKCFFGDIVNRKMVFNDAGRMVGKWYGELENKFPDIKCDEYIIMPNHFHAIIQNVGADPVGPKPVGGRPTCLP